MTEHRRDQEAIASDKRYERWSKTLATSMQHIELYAESVQEDKPTLVSFSVKCDADDEKGVLIVGRGYLGNDWYVCFQGGISVTDALTGFGNRLRNGSMKWKEDAYANNK